MLDQDTKRRIDSARQILVGKVPDPKAQVEQITTALIYKFMDDMDRENEELGSKAKFITGKLKQYAWGRLLSRELSGQERLLLYMDALTEFSKSEQIPELFRTIFKGTFLPYRDPETLNLFLKEINHFSYDHSEQLGNAYEYLLSILGSQGDAGQFRTPRHIIDFIVEVIDPKKTDKILDPACGTAGFLISAYKHIWRENSSNYKADEFLPGFAKKEAKDIALVEIQSNGKYKGDKLNPATRKKLGQNIIGYDISPDMVRLSLVNMYLHGFNTPKILEYDSLTYEDRWGEMFDIILANPPFMSPKGGIRPHKRFQIQANRAELLFVDYIAEHLTLKGRAGVIVPEGIIFQSSNAYKSLRKMLLEENYLWAVVSLPAGVFKPYSGVKTSILFLDRERAKKNDEILFVKVSNDGFDLGDQRRAISKNDLPEAYSILQEWQGGKKEESKLANWVSKKEILESGDYNLTGERYRKSKDNGSIEWPLVKLGDSRYFSIESGGTPDTKKSDYWNGPIDWITLVDLPQSNFITHIRSSKKTITELGLKKSSAKLLPENTVVVSSRATIGRIGIARTALATNQGFKNVIIKDFSSANENFVAYMVSHLVPDMIRLGSGGTYKEISKTNFSKLEIPLPPLEVQKEIVGELDGYQRVIDGARQVVENWKPSIRPRSDWELTQLGDISEFIGGFAFKSSNLKKAKKDDDHLPVIKIGNLRKDGTLETNKCEYYKYSDSLKKYIIKVDDVLIAMTGATVGKVAASETTNLLLNQRVGLVRAKPKEVHQKILKWVLLSNEFYTFCQRTAGGGAQGNISPTQIKRFEFRIPPISEQAKIIEAIEAEQKAVESAKKLIAIHEQKIKNKIAEVWGE